MLTAVMCFRAEGSNEPNNVVSGSKDFIVLFGHVMLGYAWARMAVTAKAALANNPSDPDFYENKIRTGRYYMSRCLPETGMRLARIQSGAAPVMDMPAEAF